MASFDEAILSSIVNMKKEEINVISKLIKKTTIHGSFYKIIDAWNKRCQELEVSPGDIPEMLESKRRKETKGRSSRGKNKYISIDFNFSGLD